MAISKRDVVRVRRGLLAWYGRNARDLPWRRTRDPYRIWISEVMLQQTRVETVIPYYARFLERFPTNRSLAEARQEEVLKIWEGLGYYGRARNLQAAARELESSYAGRLPRSSSELKELPGFGPYTAASVASIAFGEPVACVDGNVRRVVSRLAASNDGVEETARLLVDPGDPSSFNQGMMELGALICLPRNPRCPVCPLRTLCRAFRTGVVARHPAPRIRRKPALLHSTAVVLVRNGKVYLRRRPSTGRYGGLWEFPTFEHERGADPIETARRGILELLGATPGGLAEAGRFRHDLTHRSIRMTVVRGTLGETPRRGDGRWTSPDAERLPLARLQRRVADLIRTS
jgi:A/G-specific adenine glycosylase